jgi:hypothetical protein
VASRKKATQRQDLAETFTNMCRAQLKLNPKKCVFGVRRGRVLGCLVSVKGIKANPDKINAIVHMKPLQSREEVQRLTGKMKITILQSTQRLQQFSMRDRTARSFRCSQRSYTKVAHSCKPTTRLVTHFVCLRNAYKS